MVRELTKSRFVVLSPSGRALNGAFQNPHASSRNHSRLLASVQRFRGAIYAADGAVPKSALLSDGRHEAPGDDQAWHLVSVSPSGKVRACLRYLEESDADCFDKLLVRHAAAAASEMGPYFRLAVERELMRARMEGMRFGEVGGWAVDENLRNTTESIRILLAMYGLLELLGGCLGVATATFRHQSACILRRIGLSSLQAEGFELPPYFEPIYDCQMEILRFDSRRPNAKYQQTIRDLASDLKSAPVLFSEPARVSSPGVWSNFEIPAVRAAVA